ncbi:type II toxin-antitoxin system YhaV family toxin [Methylobacterium nonmethylotrophicum]|uniref:Type II toxin-antitoxin system YhaV family toxin n=1 Tax=Methylobacterium nonmethylotrophicum TaxID=1141884 RepID=A0A4Z0NPR6_9HYPH|nr:type II toxin-antitoxin system YhaV family toxin [Methylobacterium nonmethylotrophicum]TGD98278.1 type II toxin-antitoxin system YhaV family toxin [Methylobacterium nonmethylotrophicum]
MSDSPLTIDGWAVYAHPLFLDQLEGLVAEAARVKGKNPEGYTGTRAAKLLAAVLKVAFEIVPADPARPEYRQGTTLGPEYKHWFRVEFLQQYRLFYRYRDTAAHKVIILAWVNDERTLRAYGSRSDAYATFRRMLQHGNPPDDWTALMEAASTRTARDRLKRSRPSTGSRSEPEA